MSKKKIKIKKMTKAKTKVAIEILKKIKKQQKRIDALEKKRKKLEAKLDKVESLYDKREDIYARLCDKYDKLLGFSVGWGDMQELLKYV